MYTFNTAIRAMDLLLHETGLAAQDMCSLQEDLDVDRILGDQPAFPFLFQVGILVPKRAGRAVERSRVGLEGRD